MQGVRTVRRSRDERGAYSVMFALLSLVMFGMAALAVDLGNAFSRKSDVQGQADFAALAGGRELTSSNMGVVSPAVLAAVAKSMNLNQPVDGTCAACVTTSQLSNGQLADGEVQLTSKGLKVTAPTSTVDFGFASVIGQARTKAVQGSATVQIKSLGNGTMPMYAAAGCDYGPQTLADPASGHVVTTHDNLAAGTDDNGSVIASITEPSPASIPLTPGLAGPALTVTGTGFVIAPKNKNDIGKHVSKIGFFRNDGTTVVSSVLDPLRLADEYWASIANIPAAVAGVEDVWWVRVLLVDDGPIPGPGVWSSEANAQPLRVGSAQLECDPGSSSGNFGTLRLPRADVPAGSNLPMNIAVSFDKPLSLTIHQKADATGHCTNGVADAVESDEPNRLYAGTNCVGTDTGLAANAAAAGLVEGVGSTPGRLRTGTICGSNASITLGPRTYTINGDTLECFLDSRATVAAITSPSYNGGTVLSQDIYSSPRFFWVPVLVSDAVRGASERYSIIDFRPAFLTDLHVQGTNIDQIKVIFFNWHALPSRADGPVMDYLGTGPKFVQMVD
jgi:Flp pilus assembly protein TadG